MFLFFYVRGGATTGQEISSFLPRFGFVAHRHFGACLALPCRRLSCDDSSMRDF
jgi:hypothetical protein